MMIKVDGVVRQLLLHLLAVHIKETEAAGRDPILNNDQEPAAKCLFDLLQPQGFPSGVDADDFVEDPNSGLQLCFVGGGSIEPDPDWIVYAVLPHEGYSSDGSSEIVEQAPLYMGGTLWPTALSVDEAATCVVPWLINPMIQKIVSREKSAIMPEPLSEKELADFMLNRIENGQLTLNDLPVILTRYGLMEPSAFVDEVRELMNLDAQTKLEVTQEMIVALRAESGLGMMECKKALIKANGNSEQAVKILRRIHGNLASQCSIKTNLHS